VVVTMVAGEATAPMVLDGLAYDPRDDEEPTWEDAEWC
jgi:hypothetical protein